MGNRWSRISGRDARSPQRCGRTGQAKGGRVVSARRRKRVTGDGLESRRSDLRDAARAGLWLRGESRRRTDAGEVLLHESKGYSGISGDRHRIRGMPAAHAPAGASRPRIGPEAQHFPLGIRYQRKLQPVNVNYQGLTPISPHGGGISKILPNLIVVTGPAKYGSPVIQNIYDWR